MTKDGGPYDDFQGVTAILIKWLVANLIDTP
jgi:hypothetical protein